MYLGWQVGFVDVAAELIRLDALADPPTFASFGTAGPVSIPSGTPVDLPILSVDFDDRTGTTDDGTYETTTDFYNHPGETVQAGSGFTLEALTNGIGNREWTIMLVGGFDLGQPGEVILGSETYIVPTTTNSPRLNLATTQTFRNPGFSTPLQQSARVSQNAATCNLTTVTQRSWLRRHKVI